MAKSDMLFLNIASILLLHHRCYYIFILILWKYAWMKWRYITYTVLIVSSLFQAFVDVKLWLPKAILKVYEAEKTKKLKGLFSVVTQILKWNDLDYLYVECALCHKPICINMVKKHWQNFCWCCKGKKFENYWFSIFNRHRAGKVTTPLLCWHVPASDKHSPVCNPFRGIKLHAPGAFASSDEDHHRLLSISVNAPFWHSCLVCALDYNAKHHNWKNSVMVPKSQFLSSFSSMTNVKIRQYYK